MAKGQIGLYVTLNLAWTYCVIWPMAITLCNPDGWWLLFICRGWEFIWEMLMNLTCKYWTVSSDYWRSRVDFGKIRIVSGHLYQCSIICCSMLLIEFWDLKFLSLPQPMAFGQIGFHGIGVNLVRIICHGFINLSYISVSCPIQLLWSEMGGSFNLLWIDSHISFLYILDAKMVFQWLILSLFLGLIFNFGKSMLYCYLMMMIILIFHPLLLLLFFGLISDHFRFYMHCYLFWTMAKGQIGLFKTPDLFMAVLCNLAPGHYTFSSNRMPLYGKME